MTQNIQTMGVTGPNGQPMNVQFMTSGAPNGFGTVANNPALSGLYEYQNAVANGQKP